MVGVGHGTGLMSCQGTITVCNGWGRPQRQEITKCNFSQYQQEALPYVPTLCKVFYKTECLPMRSFCLHTLRKTHGCMLHDAVIFFFLRMGLQHSSLSEGRAVFSFGGEFWL
jgi:hypothetical protein